MKIALPSTQNVKDKSTKDSLDAHREILKVLTKQSGNPEDWPITRGELIKLGIINQKDLAQ